MYKRIIGCNKDSYVSYGKLLYEKQKHLDPVAIDYSYIEYFQSETSEDLHIKLHEGKRDYYTVSLRQVNHLEQIGKPNLELSEVKWELYKVAISFEWRKFNDLINFDTYYLP